MKSPTAEARLNRMLRRVVKDLGRLERSRRIDDGRRLVLLLALRGILSGGRVECERGMPLLAGRWLLASDAVEAALVRLETRQAFLRAMGQ